MINVPKVTWKRGDEVRHRGTGETGRVGWIDRASQGIQLEDWARNRENAEGHVINMRTRWEPMDHFEAAPQAKK